MKTKLIRWALYAGPLALVASFCLWLALAAFTTSGCTGTVTPGIVPSHQASYDGNAQNSGVLLADANGYVVTAHFRDRWTALVRTYGRDFKPALNLDDGWIENGDGTWRADKQRMVYFLEMNGWIRSGLKPINP